jgi:hypothetical protein
VPATSILTPCPQLFEFIDEHASAVLGSPEFLHLPQGLVRLIISRDALSVCTALPAGFFAFYRLYFGFSPNRSPWPSCIALFIDSLSHAQVTELERFKAVVSWANDHVQLPTVTTPLAQLLAPFWGTLPSPLSS